MAVTDDFTRADAATLGANWTEIEAGGFKIVSNHAEPDAFGGRQSAIYTGVSWNDDQSSEALATQDPYDWGVIVRSAGGDDYYELYGGDGLAMLFISLVADAAVQTLSTIAGGIVGGDVMKLEVIGTQLRGYKNASEITALAVTDSTYTSGSPGIRGKYSSGYDGYESWTGTGEVGGGGFTLTADSGAFSVSGTAAGLKAGRQLAAASGSFAISGTAAGLKAGRQLAAASGSFAVSGTAATLTAARRLSAASGSFTVTGTAAGLAAGRKLAAASGSFAVTGTDATLAYQPATGAYTLVAEAGAVAVAGTSATLRAARTVAAGTGSYNITGTAAGLKVGRMLAAAAGAYSVAGTAAAVRVARQLSAGAGSVTVTGTAAALTWSGTIATISRITLRGSYAPTVALTGSVT